MDWTDIEIRYDPLGNILEMERGDYTYRVTPNYNIITDDDSIAVVHAKQEAQKNAYIELLANN